MAKRKGLPWVMVSAELEEHPKANALVRRLHQPFAVLYVVRTWTHFGRWHEDGWVADTEDAVKNLEATAKWKGKPGELVAALVAVGFLDRADGRISVHGWAEWSGQYALKKAADRERKRLSGKGDTPEDRESVPAEIQRNSDAASPSPSPSPSPLASEGNDQQQGYFPARGQHPKVGPKPFWHDDDWVRRIKRGLSPDERDAVDDVLSKEANVIFLLRQGSPEWAAAEAEARKRIEAVFIQDSGRSPS